MANLTFDQLKAWRDREARRVIATGVPKFMHFPDSWLADPHFFCVNGHVSGMILSSETRGDLCMACHTNTVIGPCIGESKFSELIPDIIAWTPEKSIVTEEEIKQIFSDNVPSNLAQIISDWTYVTNDQEEFRGKLQKLAMDMKCSVS